MPSRSSLKNDIAKMTCTYDKQNKNYKCTEIPKSDKNSSERIHKFPYIQFEMKESTFILSFFVLYGTAWLFGYVFLGYTNINSYLSISCISTIFMIQSIFIKSPILRSMIIIVIPNFLYVVIYEAINDPNTNLDVILFHIPMDIAVVICALLILRDIDQVIWWSIPIVTMLWELYLTIMLLVPNYYSGGFPYDYNTVMEIMSISGALLTVLFYVLNKKGKNKISPIVVQFK